MTLRLDPPLIVLTPLGKAEAHFMTYHYENDTVWGTFQVETGEFREWRTPHIRLAPCITNGRFKTSPIVLSSPSATPISPSSPPRGRSLKPKKVRHKSFRR